MSEEQTQEVQPQEEKQTIEVPQEYADERPKWLPEKFKTPEDLANSYANLESKFGQKEDEIRNSVMKEIEEKAYSERPATAGDYVVPEIIDAEEAVDNDLLDWWADHSYENGFSQQEFENGIQKFYEATTGGYNAEAEMEQLGDNAQERVEAVGLFVEKTFSEDTRSAIDDLCSTAEGIKAMEIIMHNLKENPVSGTSQPTATLTDDKLREMMNDPRYYSPNQRDPAFVKMVDEGFRKMYNR